MQSIAHVLGATDYGGVETIALRVIHGLPRGQFRHAVVYVGEHAGPRLSEFQSLDNVAGRDCPYHPGQRREFVGACARVFRELRPDCVLAYNFGNHAMVALAARLAHVPRMYVRVASEPVRMRAKSLLLAQLARPFCAGEIAVSCEVKRQLVEELHLPAARVQVIANGCPVDEIAGRAEAARARRIDAATVRLIMVSRMDDAKDHVGLLGAFARARRQHPQLRLALAGEGPRRPQLERLTLDLGIRGEIEMLGNRTDIPELLGASDILVHATRTEGFPNVLIEAMAAGTPVIASGLPVCREILEDGVCGVVVPPGNGGALANAIVQLAGDAQLRGRLATAAASRVRRHYGLSAMLQQYAMLLGGPGAASASA